MGETPKRLVIGITGASGAIYGIRLLEALKGRVETHLVLTDWGKKTIAMETDYTAEEVAGLASLVHDNGDLAACIASGTFHTDGMIVLPCSIRTLSAVASSLSGTLLDRAADVTLKERRRLVLSVRESPLHLGHLRLMERVTEYGAIILPPMPAFYFRPSTVEQIVNQTIGKVLALWGIELEGSRTWEGAGVPAEGAGGNDGRHA
jgi:4-hydroxy-3-polyprenylbenzoate decarboxylase